ncbi:Fe2+-dependent dioxygenase [Altererythrobacter lutimaris]|uniref:Fe2+-dependent dioxygenase n=1 Tax=Altererythrobacter lutimaris TaxID=2743979 RepID=A0A850HBM4_9SPHN|nr:Fe2+-dependent dioxygenase [Altererythrobacter lutimaris]NVE94940.1 Fe2+-dependent dioxygenase [Altererythrobacter lutimaris]
MILSIPVIADPEQLAEIQSKVGQLSWNDGRQTAGKVAQAVKRNEQAVMDDPAGQALRQLILPRIVENPTLRAATRPRHFSQVMVSKTYDGGFYGPHVDNAIMGQGDARMRSDISFTFFLSSPDSYEGGELVVYADGLTQTVKAAAGNLVLYPSSSIHEVKPVTAGERVVCVGWIESMIADPTQRQMVFELQKTRKALSEKLASEAEELLALDKIMANLLRMWAQP